MNMTPCKTIQEMIAAHIDGDLGGEDAQAFEEHVRHCAHCQSELEWEGRLQNALRRVPQPSLPAGFEQRAFAKVRTSERRRYRRNTTMTWAVAASLFVGIGVQQGLNLGFVASEPEGQPAVETVTLAADTLTTVRLAFNARNPVEKVQFVLTLPAGFEVQGHPGKRRIAWQGQLKTGQNLLKLPISARPNATGILKVALHGEGKQKVFTLLLTTDGKANALNQT